MSQANPQATGARTDDYRGLAQADVDYLNTLTWYTGVCMRVSPQCSPLVTRLHIEQGTLPGGRAEICRMHAGYGLHIKRLQAQALDNRDYRPDINA